jgi:hypothetical protein
MLKSKSAAGGSGDLAWMIDQLLGKDGHLGIILETGLDVVNECIDSTMGRIHVCWLCCLSVTIRGLVGSYNWLRGWSSSLGAHQAYVDTAHCTVNTFIHNIQSPNRPLFA